MQFISDSENVVLAEVVKCHSDHLRKGRNKIQLAKNSTCFRAILDLLHSIFLNVANCTRCARAILQHLKKVSCNKSRIALERVLFYVLIVPDFA